MSLTSRTMTRRSFATLAVGVPGVAVLAACTPGEPAPPSPTANVAFTQRQTGGGAAESEAPAPAADASLPTFEVSAVDLAFEPPNFSIPPDTDISVNLTNNGALPHNWVVVDQGIETATIEGGSAAATTVNLPAGEYQIICSIPGHAEAGMVGVLTVDPSAPVPPAPGGGAAPEGGTPASGTPESGTPVATTGQAAPIAISMVDLLFEPPDVSIPANTDVQVTVTNNGALDHNWDVLGTAFKTEIAGAGDVQTITVNLAAGSYDVQCDVPGHAEAGMVGTLTVQ